MVEALALCPIILLNFQFHHHQPEIAHLLPAPAEESYHLLQSAISGLDARMFHG